jgi:hypothetical protein
MNRFTFDVYYSYSRDASNPLAKQKSAEEVVAALGYFRHDVMRGLSDKSARLEVTEAPEHPSGQRISILTSQSQEVVMSVVRECLSQQELFGIPL